MHSQIQSRRHWRRRHLLVLALVLLAPQLLPQAHSALAAKGRVRPGHPTRSELGPRRRGSLLIPRGRVSVAGYQVYGTGGVGLRERSGPGTGFAAIRVLPEGFGVDISCQDYGEVINGSNIWDHLGSGGWVSDYYINTPIYNGFSPGLPRCSQPSPPPPPPPAVAPREQHAIDWARSQLGRVAQSNGKPWDGWCDRFVANAFGRTNSGYATAYRHWLNLAGRGLAHPGDSSVPPGALAFYRNNLGGHVMISEGGGRFVSTGPRVYETGLSGGFGAYLGWAYANPEWPGR